ncbi:MAG TPA: hypothetical protein VHB50_23980 [Bryobacteraceae bacterium]|nr:hypothetical protein [Bryobacteraceae bacterium]
MAPKKVLVISFLALSAAGCGKKSLSTAPDGADASAAPLSEPAAQTQQPTRKIESHSLGAGTVISVETGNVIDSMNASSGQFVPGLVETDVHGVDGKLAIPAQSSVVMIIRNSGRTGSISELVLGLYAVNIQGTQYTLSNGQKDPATLSFSENAALGPAHASVHLQRQARLDFRLESPVQLR